MREGHYAGLTLGQLWSEHRYLFGNAEGERFPLLVKLIDAQADLSVQVHPDDAYAAHHEGGESGKTEGWYVLDCQEGAEIVYGHTCESRDELRRLALAGEWKRLLRRVAVRPGQWFDVPSGLVHALGAGLLVYEVQQNSDLAQSVAYLLVSVIAGQGQIQTRSGSFCFQRGDHLILPTEAAQQFSVRGNSEWLVAQPPNA